MDYSISRLQKVFSLGSQPSFSREDLDSLGIQDSPQKAKVSARCKRNSWHPTQVPFIGEQMGFMKPASRPLVFCTFITKGGALKSSLTLNVARMAALHNLNTCVVGLDMQGDITSSLGHQSQTSENGGFKEGESLFNETRGLADYGFGKVELEDIIVGTDLPTLSFIPETPELIALEQDLHTKNKRLYWLRDEVITPLKEKFHVIFIDCSPNWNQLITNALVSCDILLSPLECKINNFRNLKMFSGLISEFKEELGLGFKQIYVPTRLSHHRKLSREIGHWYQTHLPNCTHMAIRDTVQGEEAVAMYLSTPEYAGSTPAGLEMKKLIDEIWKMSTQRGSQSLEGITSFMGEV